eukprot:m51a1_g8837 putative serine threonine-protein kinase ctr1-like (1209) ;mRNA; r:419230-423548
MRGRTNIVGALVASSVALLALAVPAAAVLPRANCTGRIVIGQSYGQSQIERGAANGLKAAIDEAAKLTKLPLELKQLQHKSEGDLTDNVRRLLVDHCAFMIAATTPTSITEPGLRRLIASYGVPMVGTQSASMDLRQVENLTITVNRTGVSGPREVRLPHVVNIRASGYEEVDAVLSVLAQDWETLSQVSMVAHNMPFDKVILDYVNESLLALTNNKSGLLTYVKLGTETLSSGELDRVMNTLFTPTRPSAIIVCTTPNTTAQFVKRLARSSYAGTRLYFVSWVSPADMRMSLQDDKPAQDLLVKQRVGMYFTQNMPFQSDSPDAINLLRRFNVANVSSHSHPTLEGYLTGWFIYEALQQAATRFRNPPLPGDFLYTVFVDVRTFNVQGMKLGPYGDGGLSGGVSTQNHDDECNQGIHEVFLSQYNPVSLAQQPVEGATLKFAGCNAPEWSLGKSLTIVGSVDDPTRADDSTVRSGLMGAVNVHNAEGANAILLRSMVENITGVYSSIKNSNVVAVAVPRLGKPSDASAFRDVAMISPLPGFWELHYPFNRRALHRRYIHLFPSAYDEAEAAFSFLDEKRQFSRVGVIANDGSRYTEQIWSRFNTKRNRTGNFTFGYIAGSGNAAADIRANAKKYDAFFILGGNFSENEVADVDAYRLLSSHVVTPPGTAQAANASSKNVTYRLSVSPPLVSFASTSAIRTEYSTWVSSSVVDDASFQSFFVGKFLAQVVDAAKGSNPDKALTADNIIDAVYAKSVFHVGGLQIGPFTDKGSKAQAKVNQGLSTVYVVKGIVAQKVSRTYVVGDYGHLYMPVEKAKARSETPLILGLAIGLGGAAVICILILSLVIWRTRRTAEFFNIRRGELELGQCIGNGRFGSMYMADWHGTPVSVRVIDKKATPKEDQRLIKEEVLLLHKHHHPNLLMLMGYCETKTDILVVTEYLEGGTLAEFLRTGKRTATVYTLVAMAFDVLKGIAYLHSCKPPILDGKGSVKVSDLWYSNKKGAFSSGSGKSLKRTGWQPPEVVAGTILTPATDVYAFGIVLWELISPFDGAQSPAASGSDSTSAQSSSAAQVASGSAITVAGAMEITAQLGPPEIPHNASPEVADLLERCWKTQPERRPSVFQILRNWPTTFATLGAFEVPQDLIQSVGSANGGGLFSQQSNGSGGNNPAQVGDLNDDLAASMATFMPLQAGAVALQMPQPRQNNGGLV